MEINITMDDISVFKIEQTDIIVIKPPEDEMLSISQQHRISKQIKKMVFHKKGFVPGVMFQHYGDEIKPMSQEGLVQLRTTIDKLIK